MGSANGDAGTATINPLTAFGDMGNLFNNLATTNKKPKWMIQTEIDAIVANKNKAGGSPGDVMMGKLEHEFQSERVSNAVKLEDKLRLLIQKCHENRGDKKLFNAIRRRALAARQDLTVQREAAGMAKNSVINAETVERTFPIPGSMWLLTRIWSGGGKDARGVIRQTIVCSIPKQYQKVERSITRRILHKTFCLWAISWHEFWSIAIVGGSFIKRCYKVDRWYEYVYISRRYKIDWCDRDQTRGM